MTLLTTGSVLAAFFAGMVALFAPCCIVFLAPSYLAAAAKNRRWRLLPLTFVFAAGLVSRGILFLQGAGDLGSFNLNGVYDLRSVSWLTQSTEVGKFLAAMFGWDPRPSIEQVVAWLGYFVPVTYLFLRKGSPPRPPAEVQRSEELAGSASVG